MSCFSSLILKTRMSDEMSDEKGWDFEDFCPGIPRKFLRREKIQGAFFLRLQRKEMTISHPKCYIKSGGT